MLDDRVCVIGAGAAGLGTMEVFQRHGIPFDCFEQTDGVGGHWHTDFDSLHLITSRDLSGFVGHPMPADYPVFPSRDQMRDYLERFAGETGVRAHVRFGIRVERLKPLGESGRDGWHVTRSDGASRNYAGVVVCNGHLWDPHVPTYAGTYTGRSTRARTAPRRDARADGRRRQLGLRSRRRRRGRAARVDDLDATRPGVPAQGGVRPPARRAGVAGAAAPARQRADLSDDGGRRDRSRPRLPRAAGAADAQCQRAAAGRQQPAPVLDPARTRPRRSGDRTAGRPTRPLRGRHERRVRHDPLGDRLQRPPTFPRRRRDPLARRGAAAHRRPDAARRRREPLPGWARGPARPAAAGVLRKAAVVALTRSLALELAPRVRVNGIAPGWVDTPGNRATGRMEAALHAIPLGRAASPEEMADLVWFLGGERRAGYVTGETVVATGGSAFR